MLRRALLALLLALLLAWPAAAQPRFITVASTTSTEQSGLFAHLLPAFTQATGIGVRVVAVGTGQALKLGERGDADVVLVHDREAELRFVAQGWGVGRREVMHNDFVLIGPVLDPAGVRGSPDIAAAFRKVAAARAPFVTRGDDSGTSAAELRVWRDAGIDPKAGGGWYRDIGGGMGAALNAAAGMGAYTLSDRGTWLAFANRQGLAIVAEGDRRLLNPYGVMLVNPARHPAVKAAEGQAFIDWLASPAGQGVVASYRIDGQQLFFPGADGVAGAGAPCRGRCD